MAHWRKKYANIVDDPGVNRRVYQYVERGGKSFVRRYKREIKDGLTILDLVRKEITRTETASEVREKELMKRIVMLESMLEWMKKESDIAVREFKKLKKEREKREKKKEEEEKINDKLGVL